MTRPLSAEVVVVGAGPAGLAAALALADAGAEVVIAAPPENCAIRGDTRSAALLPSSICLLENLGVWQRCAAASAPLLAIRIIDATGSLARAPEVVFSAADVDLPSFGANVANAALMTALSAAVAGNRRLRWHATAGVREVLPLQERVRVGLAEGDALSARLVVGADGAASVVRRGAGIAARTWDYPQAAIAGTVVHSRALRGVTSELHRRSGPLTIVPLADATSSFVWVEEKGRAARLAGLEEGAFLAELADDLKGLAGSLRSAGPRAIFSLAGLNAERMGARRAALVGEAAHVIPPIGAQGLNMSLRDAAALADCVSRARAAAQDVGGRATIDSYASARAGDVATLTVLVDLLNRSLLSDFLPLAAARGVFLHLLANLPALRRLAVAGGLRSFALPPLMQPRH